MPREQLILGRIIWPLRAAKQSFILGNFLGCIALCGTISEMLANLRFEASEHAEMSSGSQRRMFGSQFDRLGQSRRIEVLSELGLYSAEEVRLSREIKVTRDRYLHALSVSADEIESHAAAIYGATVQLVDAMVAVRGSSPPGTVAAGSHLVDFLRVRGILVMMDESELPGEIDPESAHPEPSAPIVDPMLKTTTAAQEALVRFRSDWAQHEWDVKGVREQVALLDHPFIKISYSGKHGIPVKGPSAFAPRKALELVEDEAIGQTIVSEDLVITIEGLADRDRVSMLEGPGVGDRNQNTKLK